jgi:hypothetical protein
MQDPAPQDLGARREGHRIQQAEEGHLTTNVKVKGVGMIGWGESLELGSHLGPVSFETGHGMQIDPGQNPEPALSFSNPPMHYNEYKEQDSG